MTRDIRFINGKLRIIKDYEKRKEFLTKEENRERVHEINYGKREQYQKPYKKIKGPDNYRKQLLKKKVSYKIVDESVLTLKGTYQLLDEWAFKKGFKNYDEYLNLIALGRGFTCYGEYEKVWSYYPGMPSPIKENRRDPRFLGMYIAENGINKVFEGSIKMPYKNPGYDITCPKGYKIDVKATVLNQYNHFIFHLGRNLIADYFILVAFNNILELKPLHIWIFNSEEDIDGTLFKNLDSLTISNEPRPLYKFNRYEKVEKLNEIIKICNQFDSMNTIDVKDLDFPNKKMILDVIIMLRSEGKNEILPTDVICHLERLKKQLSENTVPLKTPIIPDEDML